MRDTSDTVFAPGTTDNAYLWLTDVGIALPSSGYQLSDRHLLLTTDGGDQIAATRLSDHGSDGDVDGAVVWEVPADITGGTITIAPGRGPERYSSATRARRSSTCRTAW